MFHRNYNFYLPLLYPYIDFYTLIVIVTCDRTIVTVRKGVVTPTPKEALYNDELNYSCDDRYKRKEEPPVCTSTNRWLPKPQCYQGERSQLDKQIQIIYM